MRTGDRCPEGWTQLNNRCYIYKDEYLTFDQAESACKLSGGKLASIHTHLQTVVVNELIEVPFKENGVWIGLYTDVQGEPMWTDGSNVVFDFELQEFLPAGCVAIQINGFQWSLTECTTEQPYICARDVFQCVSICKEDKL
ncbi:galactose-specific lectin nattectin-like isoform X2 [Phyllopteryx taeniolatus]|uniref:galactose-specific lectin nattectin-like isoform X2 n=1 Tax=Phyllopteryx taeniolatus TaxID=161469 RepID=UPI002AD52DB5|nr:galactose-specific lectin nattectin-like isoform X2 [Phyllopteryx taeniolatus]